MVHVRTLVDDQVEEGKKMMTGTGQDVMPALPELPELGRQNVQLCMICMSIESCMYHNLSRTLIIISSSLVNVLPEALPNMDFKMNEENLHPKEDLSIVDKEESPSMEKVTTKSILREPLRFSLNLHVHVYMYLSLRFSESLMFLFKISFFSP